MNLNENFTVKDAVEIIVSIIMLLLTIINLIGVYNLRKHQEEAKFGFYLNLQAHIGILKNYLMLGETMPSWVQLIGSDYTVREKNNADMKIAEQVEKTSEKFLDFLSKADNQVPPYFKKTKRKKWKESFDVIRKDLMMFTTWNSLCNVYEDWNPSNCEESYSKLLEALNFIEHSINKKY